MFLEIEGSVLINLAQVSRIEMRHSQKTAILYGGGVTMAESHIAFDWIMANSDKVLCKW